MPAGGRCVMLSVLWNQRYGCIGLTLADTLQNRPRQHQPKSSSPPQLKLSSSYQTLGGLMHGFSATVRPCFATASIVPRILRRRKREDFQEAMEE